MDSDGYQKDVDLEDEEEEESDFDDEEDFYEDEGE